MLRIRDISIRNKLILMQVFTSILVLSIVFTVFIATDISYYKSRKVNSMLSLAQVIGTNSVSTLQFQDSEAAREILADLDDVSDDIIEAGIVDSNGVLFASYSTSKADTFNIPGDAYNQDAFFINDQLWVSNPISTNDQVIGRVFIKSNLAELREIKRVQYQLAAILLVMALAISFAIAIVTQPYISKRLLKLVAVMKKGRNEGNYETIQDKGNDEISTLINVYNGLMQQVKENQQRKDEFIGIASHELKTPLTSIKGYMEILKSLEDTEPKRQFVNKALDNVAKLETLIKDLLDVSKIQSGQLELNITEFDIDELLNETIAAIQVVHDSHTIVRKDNLTNETILGDRQRIEQVLINLLSNAIKYSPGEDEVIVYSKKTASELIITIKDFGIGVPQEEAGNIFERFYRTKDISVHISGFGLGLYICRDIIRRHNGQIGVNPEEKGSAFYFSLPLKMQVASEINNNLER